MTAATSAEVIAVTASVQVIVYDLADSSQVIAASKEEDMQPVVDSCSCDCLEDCGGSYHHRHHHPDDRLLLQLLEDSQSGLFLLLRT